MGTCIRVDHNLDIDAIVAEGIEYYVEITREQASKIAAIVDAANVAFVHNDEPYDVFVESFGLSRLAVDQIAQIRAIAPEAEALITQILRHDMQMYVTEALGLGHGRYMLARECNAARDVSMNLATGNFSALWSALGFAAKGEDGTCGQLPLDQVEQALNDKGHLTPIAHYEAGLRDVIAYGRQVGAAQLYWA